MAHQAQERYSPLILAKLRSTLVTKDNAIFNTAYEGNPVAGKVKIPVRDTEVEVKDYDKATGLPPAEGATTYMDLDINKDKAVNEIIDGFDAAAVPDGIIAERLDSAGYSLALNLDKEAITLLETQGTAMSDTAASTKANIYANVVAARTALSKAGVPQQGRFLIVSPEVYGLLLQSDEFIRQADISQKLKETGAIGQVAGFAVYESANAASTTEFIAGHPTWCHRVMEWKVEPYLQDLAGDSAFIGASAVKGRLVYGMKVSRALAVQVKKNA